MLSPIRATALPLIKTLAEPPVMVSDGPVRTSLPPWRVITKTSNNSTNMMFPKDWDENCIKKEVDAAWNDLNKLVQADKWISVTLSGVKVEGWILPRKTVYPVYQAPKKR